MMTRHRSMHYRGHSPGVRSTLNQMYATGSLILAAFIGLVYNSWLAFGSAAAILLALNIVGGHIRLAGFRR